ncbi:MAG: ethanolamine ammonia-lyase reactivating factor EutA, partial [Eubacterium sp.]|nr:ethanolamine ammonia-lyase reactivating factor EutA [Eubacterium sp.]
MPYQIISTGIDIGTTTTQLIFSRLTLEKSGGYGTPPRIDIINREVIYKSNIYITPLTEEDIIDAEKAAEMIRSEYRKAGFSPSDITSGAVIITGESSRKRNAQKVTEAIAHLSGDFVVAAAGPDFESLLAGRGSGADRISKRDSKTVLNIDIGGG